MQARPASQKSSEMDGITRRKNTKWNPNC